MKQPSQSAEEFLRRRRPAKLWFGVILIAVGIGISSWGCWHFMTIRARVLQSFEESTLRVQPTTQQVLDSLTVSSQTIQFWAGFALGSVTLGGAFLFFTGCMLLTDRRRDALLLKMLAADRSAT